ncbi:MAG: TatD family hydrolase [Gammaproteobacteria bacterium]
MLIDSHCHLDMLDLSHFDGGLDGVLDQGSEMGVGHYLCVSVDLEAYPSMRDLVSARESVSISVGVHPNHDHGHEPDADELIRIARRDGCVAIGETGLDYFRGEGDLEWQRERFRTHIAAARECGLPLIIHTREAREDTLRILEEEGARDAGGVMHCFAEDWETAKRAMDIGFYISFSGIVTFKSAVELKDVARQVPADLMLVETDSPYLAPVPKRGKPNQPAFVRHTAEYVAELRGMDFDALAAQTSENYQRLFGALGHMAA